MEPTTPVKIFDNYYLETTGYDRYFRDRDWAKHCTDGINSINDVIDFVNKLPEDCSKKHWFTRAVKEPYWTESSDNAKSALSYARRVNCCCHETGSFRRLISIRESFTEIKNLSSQAKGDILSSYSHLLDYDMPITTKQYADLIADDDKSLDAIRICKYLRSKTGKITRSTCPMGMLFDSGII